MRCLLSVGRGICSCSSAGYRGIQRASGTQKTEKAEDCRFSGMLVKTGLKIERLA